MFNAVEIERFNVEPDLPDVESVFGALFTLITEDRIRLSDYDAVIQWGGKRGQSLYTHVMDMLYLLYTIRQIVAFESDDEAKVLICAVILHDLNKLGSTDAPFGKLARAENVGGLLVHFGLDQFFPECETYINDIALIIQSHSGHNSSGGGALNRSNKRYSLDPHRLKALVSLIRALDVADLAHGLDQHKHQDDFLFGLNTYLADSGRNEYYELHRHRLVEQRGLLTNFLHNALMHGLSIIAGWQPTLLYPDGVVYLARIGHMLEITTAADSLSGYVKRTLDAIQFNSADSLLEQTHQGIKFKPDAWISGVEIELLWNAANNLVARRAFKTVDLESKARERATKSLLEIRAKSPERADRLEAALNSAAPLITAADDQMRSAELLRTYYIALVTYAESKADPWTMLYQLAELPHENFPFYDSFDARWDRPYILARDIPLTREEILARIIANTPDRLPIAQNVASDADAADPLWATYLRLYCVIDDQPLLADEQDGWGAHVQHYMTSNHEQCVQCSSPFDTESWKAGDLRTEELKVQAFSNRLGAGGGEPKKNVCPICRMQFLLEKLNYPVVRGEAPLYVHFFPYSFLTPIVQTALYAKFQHFKNKADAVAALNVTNLNSAIEDLTRKHRVRPLVTVQTKAGKAHPYGIYIPTFPASIAGMITLPLNPAGDNDTERYLYALWTALIWGRTFNMKMLLSKNAVPPLPPEALPSVFLDMVPIAVQGLLPRQEYKYQDPKDPDDTLEALFAAINALFRLKPLVGDALKQEDTLLALVRAMNDGALGVFHSADRLMEKYKREFRDGREALPHLTMLATYVAGHTGDHKMSRLTDILDQMAGLAWSDGLRGTKLNRSGLLYALTEVFDHMNQISPQFDADATIAATKRDMFDHLDRISQKGRGRNTQEAVNHFVDLWYNGVVHEIYGGKLTRVLQDERQLKSAYLFYVQSHIPRREKSDDEPLTETVSNA